MKKLFSITQRKNKIIIEFFGIKLSIRTGEKISLYDDFIKQKSPEDFNKKCNQYFNDCSLKLFSKQEILIYITNLLELEEQKKAQEILNNYIKLHSLKDIHRFLPVAKFAYETGIKNEKIEKAYFVYNALEQNNKNNFFQKLIEKKSIAVVGNGPSEIGKNKGKKIDSYDIVIRMNNYQTKGFEKDYGTKTDIWVRGFGAKDLKDYTLNSDYIFAAIAGDYKHIPLFWDFQLDILYRDLKNNKPTGYISPELYKELRQEFEGDPTTGLSTIYTLLKLDAQFDVYGFSFLQETQDDYATHYFNDRSDKEARKKSANHSLNKESEYLRKIITNKDNNKGVLCKKN